MKHDYAAQMDSPEFVEFPKMPRLTREVVVTEKLDGTNACVLIAPIWWAGIDPPPGCLATDMQHGGHFMMVGSRSKWITRQADNHGFAAWAAANAQELFKLGEGRHFGEWWGQGIQRKYGLTEKRFSLFNSIRWCMHDAEPGLIHSLDPRAAPKYQQRAPACCHVVPVLYRGAFDTARIDGVVEALRSEGSRAAPGFMKPEGVVVFHVAGNVGFKKTIEKDEVPKALWAKGDCAAG